jgi:hypothetical protein
MSRKRRGEVPPSAASARETLRALLATIKAKEAQLARLLTELTEARALLSSTARSTLRTREIANQRPRTRRRTRPATKATTGWA